MRLTNASLAGAALVLLGAACTNDFGSFEFGSGGAGGEAATSTSSSTTTSTSSGMGGMMTTTSSSSSSSSSGMGGGPVMCSSPLQCPGMDRDCRIRACENMICGFADRPVGLNCNEMGGTVCDGMGTCVECVADADCTTLTNGRCDMATNTCLPADCMDNILNGMETDVDCGGGTCNPCMNNDDCMLASDCMSNLCDANMKCVACTLDTDCAANEWCDAGVCTPQGVLGDACGGDNECLSGNCPGDDSVCCDTACGSTCEACLMAKTGTADGTCDAVTTGTDPDTECTANTATCSGDFCSGTAGSCEPAMAGLVCRPKLAADACDVQEVCDGVNTGCPVDAVEPVGTSCRMAADLCDQPEACDGTNKACPPDQLVPDGQPGLGIGCGNYLCDGMNVACPTTCAGNVDCITPSTCQGGTGGGGGAGGGMAGGMCL